MTANTQEDGDGGRDTLAFDESLVDAVVSGSKTATVRYDVSGVSVGDHLTATTPDGEPFADIEVTRVADVPLSDALPVIDAVGAAYTLDSQSELVSALNGYYETDITPSTTVTVVTFTLNE